MAQYREYLYLDKKFPPLSQKMISIIEIKNHILLEKAVIQHGWSRSEAHTAFNNYVYELNIMTYPLRDVLFTEFSLPKNVV